VQYKTLRTLEKAKEPGMKPNILKNSLKKILLNYFFVIFTVGFKNLE